MRRVRRGIRAGKVQASERDVLACLPRDEAGETAGAVPARAKRQRAEGPPVNPTDIPALVVALMAEGASREKATTIALHVRTVLWPAMAESREPRKEEP